MGGSSADRVLVLRTCDAERRSYNGFQWPERGVIRAPDWRPDRECGHGLHGFLWGEGDGGLANWSPDATWLVVAVDPDQLIDLGGKVKFPEGEVVFCGDRAGATVYIRENGAAGRAIVGGTATAGYGGTATAGYGGAATAGGRGTATAGDWGAATAGDGGAATAGDGGAATAGDWGAATAGYGGAATAGYGGTILIAHWDERVSRRRILTGYIGEDGLLPNVPYRVVDGKFARVES